MLLKHLRFRLSFDDPKLPPEKQVMIRGDRAQLEALCEAVETYVQTMLGQSAAEVMPTRGEEFLEALAPVAPPNSAHTVYLEPKNLVAHDLRLGSLANEESGEVVHLTASQLFDLATALDDYQAEAITLPELSRPAWLKSPGLKIAAVAVLAIGVSLPIAQFVRDVVQPRPTTVAASTDSTATANAPTGPDPNASPQLPPPGTSPSPLTLQPLQPVPSAPPIGSTQPPPAPTNSPTVRVAPTPEMRPALPSIPPPVPGAGSTPIIPESSAASPTPPPRLTPIEPDDADVAQVPDEIPSYGVSSDPVVGVSPLAMEPESTQQTRESGTEVDRNTEAARSAAQPQPAAAASGSTAFDSIPQVQEVREYFQARWQPPEELDQILEYRLLLSPDGSLQRIDPLGQASATFLDRTNMPLLGEPFVSPIEDGRSPQIRLVLDPDGKVQTFLEYGN
jgi:hypothetical protein